MGQGGADTASDAAAEGQPRVGLGVLFEKSLGPELVRLRVEILAQVHERDRRIDLHAGRKLPAGDRARDGERALGRVDHRAEAQGLLDHRVQVGVVVATSCELLAQASEHAGVAQQQLEREGEARRGRLVTRAEHRE